MKEYKIGDKIWTYTIGWDRHLIPCFVCNGSGWVIIKPHGAPDADGQKIRCEYCSRENNETPGRVNEGFGYKLNVCQVEIEGIETTINKPPTYKYNVQSCSWNTLSAGKIFDSEKEASDVGKVELEETKVRAEADNISSKKRGLVKFAWSVGYHKQAIREYRRKVEYHRKCLGLPAEEYDAWLVNMNRILKEKNK